MKPLVFTLKKEPGQRLDLAPLVPHLLDGKSAKDIAAIELQTTREKVTAGDIFKIRSGGLDSIRFEGGSARLDNIGQDMKAGEIVIEGDCGKSLGRNMSGGNLVAMGDCGPFAGSAMSGGRLEIAGDACGFLGAPLEGEMEGMSGGLLIVRGNAGERAGDRLRRGTIVIEGSSGDYPGSRMIAGTLIVLGGMRAVCPVTSCGGARSCLQTRPNLRRGSSIAVRMIWPSPGFFRACCAPKAAPPRGFFLARSSVSPETWRLWEKEKFSSPRKMATPGAAAGLRRGNLRHNNVIHPPSIKGCRANG